MKAKQSSGFPRGLSAILMSDQLGRSKHFQHKDSKGIIEVTKRLQFKDFVNWVSSR